MSYQDRIIRWYLGHNTYTNGRHKYGYVGAQADAEIKMFLNKNKHS